MQQSLDILSEISTPDSTNTLAIYTSTKIVKSPEYLQAKTLLISELKSEDLTMNEADFFKILTNLKIFGEYYDGNTHYWTDRKFDDDGNAYTLIIADIPHDKFTEQITFDVKEL